MTYFAFYGFQMSSDFASLPCDFACLPCDFASLVYWIYRFGGQAVNVREQQDALEFYNAIFDSIDEGMKAIGEPPICETLFGGTFADQKICKDCPHR